MERSSVGGLPANTAAALSYIFPVVGGVLFLVIGKENSHVRFHATQSLVLSVALFGGLIILTIIPILGWILLPFWLLLIFVFWLVAIVKSWQGEAFKLPILGRYAEQLAKKD